MRELCERSTRPESGFDLVQQRQPALALPGRHSRHAAWFEGAVDLGRGSDGVGHGEEGEAGEAQIEGVGVEVEVLGIHDVGVDGGGWR